MVGKKIGGVNVFGGGLALYNSDKNTVGGLGASGNTSCADHNIAWRVRHPLDLDFLSGVGGVSGDATRPDNIVFDIIANPNGGTGNSAAASAIPPVSTPPARIRCRSCSKWARGRHVAPP